MAAKVLAIANEKGGSGKSTTAFTLAGTLAKRGFRVAVLDADPKGRFAAWHKRGGGHGITLVIQPDANHIPEEVAALTKTHDIVLIDTAGHEATATTQAILMSDLVLSPSMTSAMDFDGASELARMVRSSSLAARRDIPALVILTGVKDKSNVAKAARGSYEGAGLMVAPVEIPHSVLFGECSYTGQVPSGGTIGVRIDMLVKLLQEMQVLAKRPAKNNEAA